MFRFAKGMAVSAIRPFLKEYIAEESLDADLVSFGVNGSLTLNNVKLNIASILKNAGVVLPIQITGAFVEKLSLSVSWTSLLSSPIKAELQGLYITASTTRTVAAEDHVEGVWHDDDAVCVCVSLVRPIVRVCFVACNWSGVLLPGFAKRSRLHGVAAAC